MRRRGDMKEKSGTIPIVVVTLAALNGAFLFENGLFMLVVPLPWYHFVPGVTHTGSFNQHFIRDIGLIQMFLGAAFGVGMIRPASRFVLWAAATSWLYRACRFASMGSRSRHLLCVDNSSRFSRSHSPGLDWPCPYDVGLGQSPSSPSPDVDKVNEELLAFIKA
jgi:hypothetical protein